MRPPESCCCCALLLGVKIGAGLLLAYVLLALTLVLVFADEDTDAFCSFEHLEESAECAESCAVHESGAWFSDRSTLDRSALPDSPRTPAEARRSPPTLPRRPTPPRRGRVGYSSTLVQRPDA